MKKILLRLENVVTENERIKGLNKLSFLLARGEMIGILTANQHGINDLIDVLEKNKKIKEGRMYFEEQLGLHFDTDDIIVIDCYPRHGVGLSIAENLFILGKQTSLGFFNKNIIESQTNRLLRQYGISHDATVDVSVLNPFEKCLLQMLRASISNCKIIILEDISKILTLTDLEKLLEVIAEFKKRGISFIYINSFPDEIFNRCDRTMIYNNGKIIKHFYCIEDFNNAQLLPKKRLMKNIDFTARKIAFSLSDTGLPGKFMMPINLYQGECLTILDRNYQSLDDILRMLYYQKKIDDIQAIETIDQATLFFIPKNAIEHSLFKECSYLFNLSFYLDKKIKKNLIPEKYYNSIKKEFLKKVGKKVELDTLKDLSRYDLIELIYQRAILHKPDVVILYQPFFECDLELQSHINGLILSLKQNNISVLILTSIIANLETLSESIVEL